MQQDEERAEQFHFEDYTVATDWEKYALIYFTVSKSLIVVIVAKYRLVSTLENLLRGWGLSYGSTWMVCAHAEIIPFSF